MSEARPKVFLLDVEGTVAPLSLTAEVLFPYARAHFQEFLQARINDAFRSGSEPLLSEEQKVMLDLLALWRENRAESDPYAPRIAIPPLPAVRPGPGRMGYFAPVDLLEILSSSLKYIYWLMDRDRKSTSLKSLQGKIWKAGFESGELKGTLFDDVPDAFKRWSANDRVAIYSSGSVEAQKLLFRHSVFGDLTPLIAGHFDTRTGPKTESRSYATIAAAMQVAPSEVRFFSDVVRELDAAREAGFGTRLVVREGNSPVEDAHGHAIIRSFNEAS
jgi:2,3-diketo-5-methylthio-1-phosphopentane phosphatase